MLWVEAITINNERVSHFHHNIAHKGNSPRKIPQTFFLYNRICIFMFANHVNNLVRATTNNIKISVVFAEGYFEGLDDNRYKKPVLEIMQWLIHKNNNQVNVNSRAVCKIHLNIWSFGLMKLTHFAL